MTVRQIQSTLVNRILVGMFFMGVISAILYLFHLMLAVFFWSPAVFSSLFVIGAGMIAYMADEISLDWAQPRIRIRSLPGPDDEEDDDD